MEFLSQYNGKIVYVKGQDNLVADALSCIPVSLISESTSSSITEKSATPVFHNVHSSGIVAFVLCTTTTEPICVASTLLATDFTGHLGPSSILSIAMDDALLDDIRSGYKDDLFAISLQLASVGMKSVSFRDGFWFIGKCLVIPKLPHICEALFHLAHNTLGHFGSDKLYAALRHSYYWPNMHKELEEFYVPSCVDCQHNKSSTMKPLGPLHPLPIQEQCSDSVAIDFIGPLLKDVKFDCIVTFTDCLGSNIQIVPTSFNLTAEHLADLFCNKWYCENGLPLEIISDCDKLFMSQFWKSLHRFIGVKVKLSTSYHQRQMGAASTPTKL